MGRIQSIGVSHVARLAEYEALSKPPPPAY